VQESGEDGESEQIFIEKGVFQKNLKLQGNIRCHYWMKNKLASRCLHPIKVKGEKRECQTRNKAAAIAALLTLFSLLLHS
jgi:hypothetical protein